MHPLFSPLKRPIKSDPYYTLVAPFGALDPWFLQFCILGPFNGELDSLDLVDRARVPEPDREVVCVTFLTIRPRCDNQAMSSFRADMQLAWIVIANGGALHAVQVVVLLPQVLHQEIFCSLQGFATLFKAKSLHRLGSPSNILGERSAFDRFANHAL